MEEFTLTKEEFDKVVKVFKQFTKNDNLKVSFNDYRFLIECSELEMYRIAEQYNFGFTTAGDLFMKNNNISFGYSKNLKTFYLMLDSEFNGSFTTGENR